MNIIQEHLANPVTRPDLMRRYCRGKHVLDIGCVNHNIVNAGNSNWLHKEICEVAKTCVGVDYLNDAVVALKSRGYNVICADVTLPIPTDDKFDVIVVGNLIEHLSSFDGLLQNVVRLLKPGGCVLISSANPFYSEQYFYTAFKNDIIVNPEHTCWIDPVTLDQLVMRYGLTTKSVYWVKERWRLSQVICNGEKKSFDMLTGLWVTNSPASVFERLLGPFLLFLFRLLFPGRASKVMAKYASEAKVKELLYVKSISFLFECFWRMYGIVIWKSPINSFELYVSVIQHAPLGQEGH